MKKIRLTREEQQVEDELIKGSYFDIEKSEFEDIAQAIAFRKRNAVLNIRVNKSDIESIKRIAKKFGIGYQTLIVELIHKAARSLN